MDRKSERIKKILALFKYKEFITVQEIVDKVKYSAATIRRDIVELEDKGLIVKKFGGILLNNRNIVEEPSWQVKGKAHLAQKQQIAAKAKEFVVPGSVVFLDAGSTCLAIANEIQSVENIKILTVDFRIAYFFMDRPNIPLYFIGGQVDKTSQSATGNLHQDILGKINIDLAFISCDAWSLGQGITSSNQDKLMLKSSVMEHSITNILAVDSSKYHTHSLYSIAKLQDFSMVITDSQLAQNFILELQQSEVNLALAATWEKTT